jgi:hypothetical protein
MKPRLMIAMNNMKKFKVYQKSKWGTTVQFVPQCMQCDMYLGLLGVRSFAPEISKYLDGEQ